MGGGQSAASNPYGQYSATRVVKPYRTNPREPKWKKSSFSGIWTWVGTGPRESCGSCSEFEEDFTQPGDMRQDLKKSYEFEGPKCTGQDTRCPQPQQGGARKKRKPSKKTRKGSRR